MDRKRRLVLIGGGGHCKSVLDAAYRMDVFHEIVITDREIPAGTKILDTPVVGTDDMLPALFADGWTEAFVTVGSIKSTKVRRMLYEKAAQLGFDFPVIRDPSAQVSDYALLGAGVVVGKHAVINADAEVGSMAIINTGAIIEHECRVGSFSHVAVGATLCGNVTVEENVFVGAGTTILQGCTVCSGAVIGAGSLVLNDVQVPGIYTGVIR